LTSFVPPQPHESGSPSLTRIAPLDMATRDVVYFSHMEA
jgi:hypothetical protein